MIRADYVTFIDEVPISSINNIPLILDYYAELVRTKNNTWSLVRSGDFIRDLDKFECNYINSTIVAMGKLK